MVARISQWAFRWRVAAAVPALLVWAGVVNAQVAGVVVDAGGVLHKQVYPDPSGQLTEERRAAARSTLDPKLAAQSKLRKVSLPRLEAAYRAQLAGGRRATDEMLHLAGLTRLRYVFFYPETADIVIAGPGEGWAGDLSGRACALSSGRPVLMLEDLVVALRAFRAEGDGGTVIGCSIDPTEAGLARMQEFLRTVGVRATPADTERIVEGLRSSMGMQTVRVLGVSPATHFAQVMVEADYRMKLIGIGLERPPVKLASYVDRASAAQVARNALQRWYFTPDYQCVRVSDDGLAMELVGDGVKLVGEDEMVTAGGERRASVGTDRASHSFVTSFTKCYGELADKSPVFAQLRNLMDMSIAAAFIQQEGLYGKSGWTMATFGDEDQFRVETCAAPTQVETVVTSVWKGNRLMTPLGGGVNVQAELALASENVQADHERKLSQARQAVTLELAPGQWWWD